MARKWTVDESSEDSAAGARPLLDGWTLVPSLRACMALGLIEDHIFFLLSFQNNVGHFGSLWPDMARTHDYHNHAHASTCARCLSFLFSFFAFHIIE